MINRVACQPPVGLREKLGGFNSNNTELQNRVSSMTEQGVTTRLLPSCLYKGEFMGLERFNDLPEALQLANSRARMCEAMAMPSTPCVQPQVLHQDPGYASVCGIIQPPLF